MTKGKFFALFLLCTGAPLALAKLSLEHGWFGQGHTNNKGQWLEREIQLSLPAADAAVDWHLLYVQRSPCEQSCEKMLYGLQQLYTGLGRKQVQLRTLVAAPQAPAALNHYAALSWIPLPEAVREFDQQVLLLNRDGLVLLRYPLNDQLPELAKNIRTDLLRLMNYDRGGL